MLYIYIYICTGQCGTHDGWGFQIPPQGPLLCCAPISAATSRKYKGSAHCASACEPHLTFTNPICFSCHLARSNAKVLLTRGKGIDLPIKCINFTNTPMRM